MWLFDKSPFGIKLQKSTKHELSLAGTEIAFSLPPASLQREILTHRPFEYGIFDYSFNDRIQPLRRHCGFVCYSSGWSVYVREIFKKHIGDLGFTLGVFYANECNSVFSPRQLEKSVNRHIDTWNGPDSDYYLQNRCRLDWHYRNINNTYWLSYQSKSRQKNTGTTTFLTPIEDVCYLYINFHKLYYDIRFDADAYFNQIIDKLMTTVKVELSDAAIRQQQAARIRWPNEQPTDFLPEMTWNVPPVSSSAPLHQYKMS